MRRLQFFIHALAHLANDSYGGFLAPLLPLLAVKHDLSLAAAGLLVTAQMLSASLFQPMWGWLSDRYPNRWFVAGGVFASGLFFSLIGVAPGTFVLVLIILAGGMGISCFHPIATAMASGMAARRKGAAIAFFVTAGTSGYALGPVFISCLVDCVGLRWTPLAAIPAVIIVMVWFFFGPKSLAGVGKNHQGTSDKTVDEKVPFMPVGLLSGISIIRAFVILTFTNFIAFYLESIGIGLQSRGFYIFAIQIGGALGVLVWGGLSDKVGRWRIMMWTPLASIPLFYLFLATEGVFSLVFFFLAGFFVFASVPVVVVSAQKMMVQRESMASALQIGFAWGSGGLLMGPVGHVGEVYGIYSVLLVVAALPALLSIMALLLKPFQNRFEVS